MDFRALREDLAQAILVLSLLCQLMTDMLLGDAEKSETYDCLVLTGAKHEVAWDPRPLDEVLTDATPANN